MKTATDTSVVIAALLGWHEFHQPAQKALNRYISRRELIIPGPVLIEAYAVFSRLPAPHRLSAKDAYRVLHDSFFSTVEVVWLTQGQIWSLLKELSEHETIGGQTYDAQIMACAVKGGAKQMLTFNRKHFERLAGDLPVVVPS